MLIIQKCQAKLSTHPYRTNGLTILKIRGHPKSSCPSWCEDDDASKSYDVCGFQQHPKSNSTQAYNLCMLRIWYAYINQGATWLYLLRDRSAK
jgi:hypothetical protein